MGDCFRGGAHSEAFNAAAYGDNNLVLQIALFISAQFFDPAGCTVKVGSLDSVGLLVMQPQTMHWTDNIIQLANYKFQIQTSQDQTGQTSGQYSIVSIRPADQFPVDGSQNPVTLPDSFVSQVPSKVITTQPGGSSIDLAIAPQRIR